MLRLKIKIQSDKENVELDFLSLRRMIWGLLNVLILKKIWFAYFTNFWKIVCFPSLLSGLSLLKVLLPEHIRIKDKYTYLLALEGCFGQGTIEAVIASTFIH